MDRELIIPDTGLSMDGFQVVRREFFAHTKEPSLSFSRYQAYVNAACLAQFEDAECAQVLINPQKHILALRPCQDSLRDSLLWCVTSDGHKRPRKSTCKLFFAKIAAMMGWDQNFRYRISGRRVCANGEALLVFDLADAEAYPLDGNPPSPVFPNSWRDQFGLPVEEHAQTSEVPVFDSYSIFTIGESNASEKEAHESIGIGENGSRC